MAKASTADLRDGFDAVQADMAEHQRRIGVEITPDANHALAADEFGKLENQGVFDRAPTDSAGAPAELAPASAEEREVDGKKYKVVKDGDAGTGNTLPMSIGERERTVKALKRLHLLLTMEETGILGAPSWKTRAVAVMAHMQKDPVRFAHELDELLEASIKPFGDWKVDPDRKIYVGA